jgi:hypothetical protein
LRGRPEVPEPVEQVPDVVSRSVRALRVQILQGGVVAVRDVEEVQGVDGMAQRLSSAVEQFMRRALAAPISLASFDALLPGSRADARLGS